MQEQATSTNDVTNEFKNKSLAAKDGEWFEIDFSKDHKPKNLPHDPVFCLRSKTPGNGGKGDVYQFDCYNQRCWSNSSPGESDSIKPLPNQSDTAYAPFTLSPINSTSNKVVSIRRIRPPDQPSESLTVSSQRDPDPVHGTGEVGEKATVALDLETKEAPQTSERPLNPSSENIPGYGDRNAQVQKVVEKDLITQFNTGELGADCLYSIKFASPDPIDDKIFHLIGKPTKVNTGKTDESYTYTFYVLSREEKTTVTTVKETKKINSLRGKIKSIESLGEPEPNQKEAIQRQKEKDKTKEKEDKTKEQPAPTTLKTHLGAYEPGKELDEEYIQRLEKFLESDAADAETETEIMWPFDLLRQLFDKHLNSFGLLPKSANRVIIGEFQTQLRATQPDREKLAKSVEMADAKGILTAELPEDVQRLITLWKALHSGADQDHTKTQRAIEEKLAAILKTGNKPDIQEVDKFLREHNADQTPKHPLYGILLSQIETAISDKPRPKGMREVAMRFNRDTLIGLVEGLQSGSITKKQAVIQRLLDVLCETFAQEFYSLRESSQLDHYQKLGNALFDLVEMLDQDLREPYYWRLFSYMREAWGHIAHNLKPGANESGGARGYLEWLMIKVDKFPNEIRELFLLSLVIGKLRYDSDTESAMARSLVEYVWQASGAERQARRMRIEAVIPESSQIQFKFLQSYGYKGEQESH